MGKCKPKRAAARRFNVSESKDVAHATFSPNMYRKAVLAACDRYEKAQEFKAQHGPVRVLFKDGKPVNPDATNDN